MHGAIRKDESLCFALRFFDLLGSAWLWLDNSRMDESMRVCSCCYSLPLYVCHTKYTNTTQTSDFFEFLFRHQPGLEFELDQIKTNAILRIYTETNDIQYQIWEKIESKNKMAMAIGKFDVKTRAIYTFSYGKRHAQCTHTLLHSFYSTEKSTLSVRRTCLVCLKQESFVVRGVHCSYACMG